MATYVTSDLHGMPPQTLLKLLEKVNFSDGDWLYVLGDVIDRGEHGLRLLNLLMRMSNAQLILGNHEDMLLSCRWIFDELTDDLLDGLDDERMGTLSAWLANGAQPTLDALKKLQQVSPETLEMMFDYLEDTPLYDTVSTDAGDFLLVHAGLGGFSPNKKLRQYSRRELLWTRPAISDAYFEHITTVFGHTPTAYYGDEHAGKMLFTDTWIDTDTGGVPALLCLDDRNVYCLNAQEEN